MEKQENDDFFSRIRRKLDFWVGSGYELDLETRIFHAFSLIAIVFAASTFFVNLYIGLEQSVLISLSAFLLQSFLYYISRFKGKQKQAIIISAWALHILLALNYFLNQGIKGPSLLLYTAAFFFITVVSYRSKLIYLFIGNSLLVGVLLLCEYINPKLLAADYASRDAFFIDSYFTYIITISLIYTGTSYLLRSYVQQRKMLMEKAEALKKINKEKDKLFSIISHDLRTPLANVHQYLEMMSSADLDKEEKKNIENKLLDTTRNTQELLTNLLYWSRNQMQSPHIHINLRPINLIKGVSSTIAHLSLIASRKGIRLNHYVNEDIIILADQDMLNLIVRNILYNAIKFTPNAGEIQFTAQQQDNRCLISIRDNGHGIPTEKQSQLFDFYTSLGTANEQGTGLGLTLCREYMLLQNGGIWFESKEGHGTTFYLSFPIT